MRSRGETGFHCWNIHSAAPAARSLSHRRRANGRRARTIIERFPRRVCPSMGSRRGAEPAAQIVFEGAHHLAAELLLELGKTAMPRVTLLVPLVGEASRRDVGGELAHALQDVEMVVRAATRELAVLAGGRVVLHLAREALLAQQP